MMILTHHRMSMDAMTDEELVLRWQSPMLANPHTGACHLKIDTHRIKREREERR